MTVDRILAREGVDRATLILAYQSLGLKWDHSFCEPITQARHDGASTIKPTKRRLWFVAFASLTCLLAVLTASGAIQQEIVNRKRIAEALVLEERFREDHHAAFQLYHAGEYYHAHTRIGRAVSVARQLNNSQLLAVSIGLSGEIAAAKGRYEEALHCYQEVMSLHRLRGDLISVTPVLALMGDIETQLGRFHDAEAHLRESLEGYHAQKNPEGVSIAQRDLGSLAYEIGWLDLAAAYFDHALTGARLIRQSDLETDINSRRALVLARLGDFGRARDTLQECLSYWTKANHKRWIAKTKLQLGFIERRAGSTRSATKYLSDALLGYQSVGDAAGMRRCQQELALTSK